ncbi:alpha/beta fold hydrolase [Prosthecobacter sp.]|uniref:esterase/lipase family protein n=1 Tax=Prosthecobacter sp. TaxID=1965333 RepID=UPI002ABB5B9E|nr:alpha/beta fold hydrolase [Prosthecobacter sp.]MDZ4403275.1 alpha/beta fold hydrolase [Prosthecobacter sp.]
MAAVVKSLRNNEGADAWAKEIQLDGARPWRLTFDVPHRTGSARTLALSEFAHCRLAAEVKLHGFDRAVAHDGLGVPVVMAQNDPRRVAGPFHPPNGEFLPATAVLEFPAAAPGQPAEARLRFYNPLVVSELKMGRHSQPLAENLTAALQFSLTDSTLDENGPDKLSPSASGEDESQLFFLNRYDSTKVPVVFVHGMRSGPSVWKNAVNELFADPKLRRRYQPACFVYPSKLSIPASAARLRELLKASRDRLDPGHHDAGFGRMVLVGHSMGGLLTRMQVIDSDSDFWRSFFTASPEKMAGQIDAKTQRMLKEGLFFERQTNIKTVVFISTPHQGSVLANNGILRTLVKLILFLPKTARQRLKALTKLPAVFIHPTLRSFHDWGVEGTENLATKHPYFIALARHPAGVPFHSIIATRGKVDYRNGSDGIVPYWSAHLDEAASETIVPYPHGCLEKPGTVQAVMKILKGTR